MATERECDTNTDRSTSMRLQHNWFSLNILAHSMLYGIWNGFQTRFSGARKSSKMLTIALQRAHWRVHIATILYRNATCLNTPSFEVSSHSEMFHRIDRGRMCATQTAAACLPRAIMIVCCYGLRVILKMKKSYFFPGFVLRLNIDNGSKTIPSKVFFWFYIHIRGRLCLARALIQPPSSLLVWFLRRSFHVFCSLGLRDTLTLSPFILFSRFILGAPHSERNRFRLCYTCIHSLAQYTVLVYCDRFVLFSSGPWWGVHEREGVSVRRITHTSSMVVAAAAAAAATAFIVFFIEQYEICSKNITTTNYLVRCVVTRLCDDHTAWRKHRTYLPFYARAWCDRQWSW